VEDGVRLAASAVRYYRQRLSLAIVANGAPEPLALDEHTCVRLVPLDLLEARDDAGDLSGAPAGGEAGPPRRIDDELEVVPTAAGDVVRIGPEVFVPTVFYRVPRELVRSALAVRAATADG
jgi:hypothetical protein